MRIGIVLPNLNGGGTQRSALRIADGFLKRGFKVDLFLLYLAGTYHKIIPSGVRIFHHAPLFRREPGAKAFLAGLAEGAGISTTALHVLPWTRRSAIRDIRQRWPGASIVEADNVATIAKYLRIFQPDTLFAALHPSNIAAICGDAVAGTATPVVISLHNNVVFNYDDDELTRARILYREADAIVAVSKGVAEGAAETLGIPKERITPIHNPIPVEEVAAAAREPVEHPWFAEGAMPVVLTVGSPRPIKDHFTLVRALAILRRSTEARLAILGNVNRNNRENVEATRALAASLGVIEHVTYLDFDENPFRYMARAGAMALSSIHEGFANVLPEAMACGTAVASTDASYGPAEILEDGRWGPLVPVGDADALAKALADILAGRRVSAEDLRTRAAAFAPRKIVNAYEELFSSLSPETASPPPPAR